MVNSFCKDCPDRHLHCHSECDRYKDYRTRKDEENKRIKREKNIYNYEKETYVRLKKLNSKKKGG